MDDNSQSRAPASSSESSIRDGIDPHQREWLADSVRLFEGLDKASLDTLLALSCRFTARARGLVCRQGEPGEALYIVMSGKLKVTTQSEDGREVILAILEDGDTFGEMSLLDGRPRSASVSTVQESELLVIKRHDFLSCLERHPKVSIALLVILSSRLRDIDAMVEDMRFLDIRSRLAKTLLRLAQQHGRTTPGGGVRLDLNLSQEDLGNLIGATRESVNKQLRSWEEDGVLGLCQNGCTIHCLSVLETVATGQGKM